MAKAALAPCWSLAQRALRKKMHRSVQNPPPAPRPSRCFPTRLAGCRRPRCETKSARAAEQQAAVQMPGSCSCLLNVAQGLAIVRWALPIHCGWSPSSSLAWKCKVQPLNSLAMETSPCCCVFTMTQKAILRPLSFLPSTGKTGNLTPK